MKILIVCSGNAPNFEFRLHQAFIFEQVEAVKKECEDIQFGYFFIRRKGILGYLQSLKDLKNYLKQEHFDYIHAHFTTSAMLATLQWRVPVVTTFHGSDINLKLHRLMSALVEILSKRTIYVSHILRQKAVRMSKEKSSVIPCGIDLDLFVPRVKEESRKVLGLSQKKKYILFSSYFENRDKNYPLAKAAVKLLNEPNVEVLELKNYTREQVAMLMTGVDVALMTSIIEGSPQFIKEALACNCPVVSTDVGDVRGVLNGINGCYITTNDPFDIADKLKVILSDSGPIDGRKMIESFDNRLIAKKLVNLYKSL